MNKKTVKDIDVKNKKVLVRVDFNVPMDENKNITDTRRITEALPTINYLVENNAKVILMSHLGRPKGRDENLSLFYVAKKLQEFVKCKVHFIEDCIGEKVKEQIEKMNFGEILLLENLRFYEEEEKNDENFAKQLASLGDIYVNDAFGTAHRAHASTYSVAKFLPAVAGFLLEKEISIMGKALENPTRPFVAILGGAKVKDKIKLIENLVEKADMILIGGGMSYTFLKAQGYNIGKSLLDKDSIDFAKDLMNKAKNKIKIPEDIIVADKFSPDANYKSVSVENIPDDWMGMDIGPKTQEVFNNILKSAKTIIWNGPVGVFEMDRFAKGSFEIAKTLSSLKDAITIIGGGDSAACVEKFNLSDKMTHISTGGGASLEFMEGKILPGVQILLDK